jgi:FkbM family methyltransferase
MPLPRLRRPRLPFAEWGHELREFHLPADGLVQYAQWRHPRDRILTITQAEVDGLRQFIAPGDFAIDVGAHSGDTTVPMALAAGATGCVLALEPNRHVFQILEVNAGLNSDRTHIIPRCLAATEDDGDFVFTYGDASFCNGGAPPRRRNPLKRRYPLKVAGRNLLRLLQEEFSEWLPKLRYVKVDAEGFDRRILQSIRPVLEGQRPVVRTEVFCRLSRHERFALFDLLTNCGYRLHRFEGGAEPLGRLLSHAQMTQERHFDVLALP